MVVPHVGDVINLEMNSVETEGVEKILAKDLKLIFEKYLVIRKQLFSVS